MKKLILLSLVIFSLILSACNQNACESERVNNISKSGEVKGQFGEQYEKKPIRMFNLDGELYYDSGLVSDMIPRCGTLDGHINKGADEGIIPHKSGEANFEIDGYQHGTSITKEVPVDGKWVIFKKYNNQPENIEQYKYCFYIKGHLNNAAIDSEIVVLTDDKDITFSDVYEPLLSSQRPICEGVALISHNTIVSGDKWGLSLYADDVTKTGMTIKFEQFGGNPTGELQTGAAYFLETTVNDEWQEVKTKTGDPLVWNALAYMIKKNDITEMNIDWQYGYGSLKPGYYRLKKEVMDFRAAGDYDKEIYEAYFTIE